MKKRKKRNFRKLLFFTSITAYLSAFLLFFFGKKFGIPGDFLVPIAIFCVIIGAASAAALNFNFLLKREKPLSEEEVEELLEMIKNK